MSPAPACSAAVAKAVTHEAAEFEIVGSRVHISREHHGTVGRSSDLVQGRDQSRQIVAPAPDRVRPGRRPVCGDNGHLACDVRDLHPSLGQFAHDFFGEERITGGGRASHRPLSMERLGLVTEGSTLCHCRSVAAAAHRSSGFREDRSVDRCTAKALFAVQAEPSRRTRSPTPGIKVISATLDVRASIFIGNTQRRSRAPGAPASA